MKKFWKIVPINDKCSYLYLDDNKNYIIKKKPEMTTFKNGLVFETQEAARDFINSNLNNKVYQPEEVWINKDFLFEMLGLDNVQMIEDIPMPTDADAPIDYKEPCYMCNNARLDHELTDYNDFYSGTIGSFSQDCRIMLTSGSGKPLRIEIARWNDERQEWEDIGVYYPKFCPECGREIREYENDSVIK